MKPLIDIFYDFINLLILETNRGPISISLPRIIYFRLIGELHNPDHGQAPLEKQFTVHGPDWDVIIYNQDEK